MKLPLSFKKYFWDVDFERLDLERRPEYIILRVLEYGDIKSVRWLFENINKKKIKEVITKQRGLSQKSFYFWTLFFNLRNDKIQCLKKSYPKTLKNHWPY